MSEVEEDEAPRLGVSTILVGLTVAVLSVAIIYNTLTLPALQANLAGDPAYADADAITGSTRVTVDAANDDQAGTVTLR
jgi:hypothetical protein